MRKLKCTICGYIYDEAAGIPEKGIQSATSWENLPEKWVCPLCGAIKADFTEVKSTTQAPPKTAPQPEEDHKAKRALSLAEMSALFSNLALGCEKQYKPEEMALFAKLADYYKEKSGVSDKKQFADLLTLIEQDLNSGYIEANTVASDKADRGALRALTWGEKVTRIHNSLLNRYATEQDLLEKNQIFVCESCGFIYVGDEAPDICPVCKVPKLKITKLQRG